MINFTLAATALFALMSDLMTGSTRAGTPAGSFEQVDTTPPMICLPDPPPDVSVADVSTISARVSDEGAGIDAASLEFRLDGKDVTAGTKLADDRVVFSVPAPPARGLHQVEIRVADKAGNFLGRQLLIEDSKLFWEVRKFDKDLKSLFTIDRINFPNPLTDNINVFEQVFYFTFDGQGNILYGNPKEYAIRMFDPEGKEIRRIEKKYTPREVTEDEKEEILERIPTVGINIKDRLIFPKHYPAFEMFTIDEEGRLIVRTYGRGKKDEEFISDVFDTEGKLITSFSSKASPRLWKNGKLYAIEENEDGINVIKRYTYRWEK